MNSYTICIPGRLASSRMSKKLIRNDTGKALMQETIDRVRNCRGANVTVTVDCEALAEALDYEGLIYVSSGLAECGTERVAMYTVAAPEMFDDDVTINCQADEPLINPRDIEKLAQFMFDNPDREIATLAAPLHWNDLKNPDVVKVVVQKCKCLAFTRRPPPPESETDEIPPVGTDEIPPMGEGLCMRHHVGVYAFRTTLLQEWAGTKGYPCCTHADKEEGLEQLEWLYCRYEIAAVEIEKAPLSINSEDDYTCYCAMKKETAG